MDEFDSIIIGSGQAAPSLAVALAKRGDRVALIEGDRLGGTCVNTGCTPTKTLRKSARVAHLAEGGDRALFLDPALRRVAEHALFFVQNGHFN